MSGTFGDRKKRNRYIIIAAVMVAAAVLLFFVFSSGLDKSAAHINYSADENYGKGNYVYDTVTFTGNGMGKETVLSVKKLEQLAYDKNKDLGYQNRYSMLTSGSEFSEHEFTGVKLYDLLISLGMSRKLDGNTSVTVSSADGYMVSFTLDELKSESYCCFTSMSDDQPSEKGIPVLLSFGSDGVPLVGPTGSEETGKTMSSSEGFDEKADNTGGPVRLIVGQQEASEYNAPRDAKWVTKVIVGENKDYSLHTGDDSSTEALKVTLHDSGNKTQNHTYTLGDIEKFAGKEETCLDRNYYGSRYFFEGADLWEFLRKKADITLRDGSVKFTFAGGGTETVSLDYLRDVSGGYADYTTEKGGLEITCVKPALGYSINGAPTEDDSLYALLPADGKEKKTSTVKKIEAIDIYSGAGSSEEENPCSDTKIVINGDGMDGSTSVSVGYLEDQVDLTASSGKYEGVSLISLLKDLGLSVDASKVTVSSGKNKVTLSLSDLEDAKDDTILATRISGKAIGKSEGPVALRGASELDSVQSVTVSARKGKWTHSYKGYRRYLDTKIKVYGSQAAKSRTYTLKELEKLGASYTVKDSFAAGGGKDAFQGAILRKVIEDNLKKGLERPEKITVTGKDGYNVSLSVEDVYDGVESKYQPDEKRDIILAYSINGKPLVPSKKSEGYTGDNAFGPVRLVVENQTAKWVKDVVSIKLGD